MCACGGFALLRFGRVAGMVSSLLSLIKYSFIYSSLLFTSSRLCTARSTRLPNADESSRYVLLFLQSLIHTSHELCPLCSVTMFSDPPLPPLLALQVETVGDCYVAVAGLPDPRKDHATVMARFARDCMFRARALTKKLEVTLGPDTGM